MESCLRFAESPRDVMIASLCAHHRDDYSVVIYSLRLIGSEGTTCDEAGSFTGKPSRLPRLYPRASLRPLATPDTTARPSVDMIGDSDKTWMRPYENIIAHTVTRTCFKVHCVWTVVTGFAMWIRLEKTAFYYSSVVQLAHNYS